MGRHSNRLEILFSIDKSEASLLTRFGVHIAFDMQLTTQSLGSTEKYTSFTRSMQLLDAAKHQIPVRSAEIGWRMETGNGITVGGVEHDVLCITR